jgi:D-lactate dehydrogenase
VILNRDPQVHLRNLQSTPPIEESATTCVECGFCEPVCPSRNVTTTPRQRILLRREMARQPQGSPVLKALLREYEYDGIQTCAADGSCGPACPLAIDTGKLIKDFRARERDERDERRGERLARRWASAERAARGAIRTGNAARRVVGDAPLRAVTRGLQTILGADSVPSWPASMPPAAPGRLPETRRDGAAAVYLPACVNRIFGNPRGTPAAPTLPEALAAVSERAGSPLWIPPDAAGHCCATPWSSKGYRRGHALMAERVAGALWRWSDGGSLPVVIDATSCALGLREEIAAALAGETAEQLSGVEILDSVEWVHDRLLPNLEISRRAGTVVLHPTCSGNHLGLNGKLRAISAALATDVVVPPAAGCCGMAGDRGLLHPELPESALRDEAAELQDVDADAHLCSNRTCEVALHEVTGRPYASFVLLMEELTRA